jgi:hypothetical protein
MAEPAKIIALDADGVLVDYNLAYAKAWEAAFGVRPKERDPHAYWATDRWEVPTLTGAPLQRLREAFDEKFWAGVPPIEGAVSACHALVAAGFELVCVTALPSSHAAARLRSLQAAGMPIEQVIATGNEAGPVSPKAEAVARLGAVALVDDYLPYLQGLPPQVHTALVMRQGSLGPRSPNHGPSIAAVHSRHRDVVAFADWWLATGAQGASMPLRSCFEVRVEFSLPLDAREHERLVTEAIAWLEHRGLSMAGFGGRPPLADTEAVVSAQRGSPSEADREDFATWLCSRAEVAEVQVSAPLAFEG